MTPEQFCYWLQGFGELSTEPPTPEQWRSIKEHLATVYRKVTPPAPGQLGTIADWQRAYPPGAPPYQATQITC
jgi:hypothetical protein